MNEKFITSSLVVEGETDYLIISRLCEYFNIPLGSPFIAKGKDRLLKNLDGYINAARFKPFIVLIDLDEDFSCAPEALRKWVKVRADYLILRIPVHAIDSWILADREGFSKFFSVPIKYIPVSTDNEKKPKEKMMSILNKSRSKTIKKKMLPRTAAKRKVGSLYSATLKEFIFGVPEGVKPKWNPFQAAQCSDSLNRCLKALNQLSKIYD